MTTLFELLAAQNPWWSGRPFDTGRERQKYVSTIRRFLRTGEIIVLSGVRRSGKTTLLYQTIRLLITSQKVPAKNILFVTCDEPAIAGLKNPLLETVDTYRREIAAKGTIYLVFDEVQAVENWEREVKSLYDRKQGNIILSGSSSYLLDPQLSTLLSGRYLAVPVFPLDFSEYLRFHDLVPPKDAASRAARKYEITTHLRQYLREGGFPIVVLQQDERTKQDYLRAYYDSIVYRDIVRTNVVRNQKALAGLLLYLLTNIASPYSYRRLKEMLGTDIDTVRDYIHFAGLAKILFEVQAFAYSLPAQARQNKKIYCIDNGLRNAVSFRFSEDEGKLAENLVFLELMRSGAAPYYWKGTREVDFVVRSTDNTLTAINVCYSDAIPDREYEGLREFAGECKGKIHDLLVLTKDYEAKDGKIHCIPLWKWLLDHESR
ncbi:MAG: ATP-binding protein [Methanoregula sp.]|uniref:ATP-binding protein n=1 Tax=Methanoregula sp. TaxID=2052170 RepID=UPI003C22763F